MAGTYKDIAEHVITHEEAGKCYHILSEHPKHYLASMWRMEVERRWSAGEDLRDLVRLVVQTAYSWHQKYMYMAEFDDEQTEEMCLDIYAAVGIDPPAHPGRATTHGG